jgi:hypothetical protein
LFLTKKEGKRYLRQKIFLPSFLVLIANPVLTYCPCVVLPLITLYQWTEFHETWYEYISSEGHTALFFSNYFHRYFEPGDRAKFWVGVTVASVNKGP